MKIGFTCGAFDLLHPGHVLMLEEAKKQCEYLVVGLQRDPSIDRPYTKHRPVQSIAERRITLSAIRFVDEIWEYDTEAELYEYLKMNQDKIEIRIIGADWKGQDFTGKDLDIPVYFNSRGHSYSSSDLRRRVEIAESTGYTHA